MSPVTTRSQNRRRQELDPPAPVHPPPPTTPPNVPHSRRLANTRNDDDSAIATSTFSTDSLTDALLEASTSLQTSSMATPRSITSDALRPHAFNDTINRPRPSKASRPTLDAALYRELWDRVAYDVESLWDVFDPADIEVPADVHDGQRWCGWPPSQYEGEVLEWFFHHIDPLLHPPADVPPTDHRVEYVPSGNLILKHGDADRKGDLLVRCTRGSNPGTYWDQVRVVGELKRNPKTDGLDKTILQLANYVREMFGTQPQRCWVLAFTLCGELMRVFRFDRSGVLASTAIDIHDQPMLFISAMKAFLTDDATALGFDPSIRWTPAGDAEQVYDPTMHFIYPSLPDPFVVAAGGAKYRIFRGFIVRRYAIATRGTVCWRARPYDAPLDSPWVYVVKDQWRAAERESEGDFLSRISRGTVGLPGYIWHADMYHCKRLMDVAGHVRRNVAHSAQDRTSTPAPLTRTSRNLYRGVSDVCLHNRVKTRIIMSPLGSPLLSFRSYKHLLTALRDAVLGHRHMYAELQIVHRDVSLNNILLEQEGACGTGFLIDFDFAIDRARQTRSGADFITGTFMYVSIEVLEGAMSAPHSPLEDLESFYYVLLDIAIHYDERGARRSRPPATTVFARPSHTEFSLTELCTVAANAKRGYLARRKFLREVVPTFNAVASAQLSNVLDQWRALIAEEYRRADECVGAADHEEDELREVRIANMYDAVLGVLEAGIEVLV
ncbi:hypothetical protein FN846DRAFT_927756 [Sphaerosporella brunnea]|uniref:EKC/KEOPS complex subunit BUD32 n=1 Tax=Sphaerosporella brunnea TaxID=1250544 RepID=A0A5J5FB41_9PEZI|nr:hypothetical protein FN846DRAFT_927756 [Sphaerosporella brunnea]